MREHIVGKDCRVDGIDYLLTRLSYVHPEKMTDELVSELASGIVESVSRRRIVEMSIESARTERERLKEEVRTKAALRAARKRHEVEAALLLQVSSLDPILDAVCEFYKVSPVAIRSDAKCMSIYLPRQVTCYLARVLSRHTVSYQAIGDFLGGKNHSSVLSAYRRVKEKMAEDPDFASEVGAIASRLKEGAKVA